MLTSFSLTQLILISVTYLSTLFGIAGSPSAATCRAAGTPPAGLHPVAGRLRQCLGVLRHGRPGLPVRLRVPRHLPGDFRGLPARPGAALSDPAGDTRLPAVLAGRPLRLPFPQYLGRRPDHAVHADRRAADAGPADPGGHRLDQHSHPRPGPGAGRIRLLHPDHPVRDPLRRSPHRHPRTPRGTGVRHRLRVAGQAGDARQYRPLRLYGVFGGPEGWKSGCCRTRPR